MSGNGDGHSPETCNYRACNASAPTGPCPFIADDAGEKPLVADYSQPIECRHDWRQYWEAQWQGTIRAVEPLGFYCTKCLLRHD